MLTTRRTFKFKFHGRVDGIMAGAFTIRQSKTILVRSVEQGGRLRQGRGLIVKGKRILYPPPQHLLIRIALPVQEYDYEHGFPLIRSLRASTQRSTSVLFSFVLSLLIMAG
jgi:hypothetical protein